MEDTWKRRKPLGNKFKRIEKNRRNIMRNGATKRVRMKGKRLFGKNF